MQVTRQDESAADWLRDVAETADRGAFAHLFNAFAPKLKSYLLRMGVSEAVAEELAQETMLTVWRKAGQFDRTRASAAAWVYAIARNLWVDALRRERSRMNRPHFADEIHADPVQEFRAVQGQEKQHLLLAMGGLPNDQVELLKLSYFEEQSHSEIAGRLGIPLGTVKSRLRRATAQLRSALDGMI